MRPSILNREGLNTIKTMKNTKYVAMKAMKSLTMKSVTMKP